MYTQFKWIITSLFVTLFLTTPIAVSAQGKFTFTIIRDGNPEDEKLADYIEKNDTFTKIIDTLNKTLVIPYDINVVLTNSKHGPHYEPDKKLIVLDYGDERWAAQQFDKNYEEDSDEDSRQDYLNNINLFSFYHELGHALIDAYKIPVVGEEEDAADSMAAVMILHYFTNGPQILLDNTDYFDNARLAGDSEENQYWDEHALNEQRYYRLLCYAYGKSPAYIEKQLPDYDDEELTLQKFLTARKDYCEREYTKLNNNWVTLLQPHFVGNEEEEDSNAADDSDDDKDNSDDNDKDSDSDSNDS
jgi:hypothetical protein